MKREYGIFTANELCIKYASVRSEIREIKKEVDEIVDRHYQTGDFIMEDIGEARKNYYKQTDYDDISPPWVDWKTCFKDACIDDPDFLKIAELWDKRVKLKKEFGRIKQLIYNKGIKLDKELREALKKVK